MCQVDAVCQAAKWYKYLPREYRVGSSCNREVFLNYLGDVRRSSFGMLATVPACYHECEAVGGMRIWQGELK
jgi:hypothetical protein